MGAFTYLREVVIPTLDSINSKRINLITALEKLPEEQAHLIERAEEDTEKQKNEFQDILHSLSIYIRMASGGEEDAPSKDGRISGVNLSKLKMLSSTEQADSRGYQHRLLDESSAQYRFVSTKLKSIDSQLENTITEIKKRVYDRKEKLENGIVEVEEQFISSFNSVEFQHLVEMTRCENGTEKENKPILGFIEVPLPISEKAADYLQMSWPDLFDADRLTINMAYIHDISLGGVYWIDIDSYCENEVIDGIQHLAIIAAANQSIEQIGFFDPIRYNDDLMGRLSSIAGAKGSPVTSMPLTDNEIIKRVQSMHEEVVRWNSDLTNNAPRHSNRVLVFYQFPSEYNGETIKSIRFLCVNAKRHGYTILLINRSAKINPGQSSDIDYIRENSIYIKGQGGSFTLFEKINMEFRWSSSPQCLPNEIINRLQEVNSSINLDNSYENRVGFGKNIPKKGQRALINIPYGVDSNGDIAMLDFEDELFGTFICGAARSGKTTMLHTIISGFLSHHPDDIEIWLIDFKKVEFAQYIPHLPPHVRYVLLENSPEIIFDIIDELSQKMNKRKDIFKANGWTKIADVPPNRPMPEVVVIIDEFSEMSGVLANSVSLSGNGEDYREKFRLLFSEGASFGFRFILSCQAFSEGTRGLAEFAKMQIQQRIVLKSQRSEIRGTLDISNLSDEDAFLIENIEPHYAIQRIPLDTRGNRLKKVHVLYIVDKAKHFSWIDQMRQQYTPVRKYISDDDNVYGDKFPITIDGNSYSSFRNEEAAIKQYIKDKQLNQYNEDIMLFIGTPLRMNRILPILLSKDYKENVLIISQTSKMTIQASIILSMWRSADLQLMQFEILSPQRSQLINLLEMSSAHNIKIYTGTKAVTDRISELDQSVKCGNVEHRIVVLLGLDQLLRELSPQVIAPLQKSTPDYLGIRYRKENTQVPNNSKLQDQQIDYGQIVKTLLSTGSLLGLHFVTIFNSTAAYTQNRIPDSFRHKILFKTSAQDAANLMIPSAQAMYFSRIGEVEYRYTNGLDKNTFRPFFHPFLSWENLEMDGDWTIHSVGLSNEDDYLV